jgi:hypothetical protein
VTKDISRKDGSDQNSKTLQVSDAVVTDGMLTARVSGARKFTTIEFYKVK